MSVNEFIEALNILSKYMEDGKDETYFMGADHDIIYVWVDDNQCPEDSEDGKRLVELGFFVYESGNWAKYL